MKFCKSCKSSMYREMSCVTCVLGLVSPHDGIKKLHQMETQTGIWTMRVQMIVEPDDIVIIDKQSGVSRHCHCNVP